MSKTGIIYKLVSRDINIPELYVGSTCSFRARKWRHKDSCNNENDKAYTYSVYQYIRDNGGWDSFDMIQIEEFKHDTKQELHARERHWIEQFKATLNKQIPTRAKNEHYQDNKKEVLEKCKQYYENNKEVIAERNKQYYENNKEEIAEQMKQYRQNNKEELAEWHKQYSQNNKEVLAKYQKQYRHTNKESIVEYKKIYQQKNKEALAEKSKLKYTCGCGSTIRVREKSTHNKTAKHLAWAAAQIVEA